MFSNEKKIIGIIPVFLVAAGAVVVSNTVLAHQVSLDGDIKVGAGYITTGDGMAVKTGHNDCLLSGDFNQDENGVDACLGIEEKVAEPEPAPIPKAPAKSRVVSEIPISGSALFALNSDQLSEEGIAAIQDVIRKVATFQGVTEIEIIGHTDSTGAADYNQALSERRAATVKDALGKGYPDVNIVELAESAPDIKLVSRGVGENEPVADNSTREGRVQNRRVQILIKARQVTFE